MKTENKMRPTFEQLVNEIKVKDSSIVEGLKHQVQII